MKKNVGLIDKIIRIVIAIIIAYLLYAKIIVGTLAIVLAVFGIIMIVTSIFGFCALYVLFGIKTCPAKTNKD
ncbi:MAG: DUF2892 domain-containing protein [Bacteroidetes bacterium]|nr:DUF2892 domain-containing protein [Bacteroidota bacterium]